MAGINSIVDISHHSTVLVNSEMTLFDNLVRSCGRTHNAPHICTVASTCKKCLEKMSTCTKTMERPTDPPQFLKVQVHNGPAKPFL